MNSSSSGKKLEGFFTGKGFYIVLFLCAAVIGVSAWMMAAGNETMAKDVSSVNRSSLDNKRVETVYVTPQVPTQPSLAQEPAQSAMAPETQEEAPALETEEEPEQALQPVWNGEEEVPAAAPVSYVWPVSGELERPFSTEKLLYDVTMKDWRTHDGVDIAAALGDTVSAARAGTVESVETDDLYGTVVTVSHGDGVRTVYANLAETPAVSAGDWVEAGDVLGSVGVTALGEIGQGIHLHFAVTVDGRSADPMDYLPA